MGLRATPEHRELGDAHVFPGGSGRHPDPASIPREVPVCVPWGGVPMCVPGVVPLQPFHPSWPHPLISPADCSGLLLALLPSQGPSPSLSTPEPWNPAVLGCSGPNTLPGCLLALPLL